MKQTSGCFSLCWNLEKITDILSAYLCASSAQLARYWLEWKTFGIDLVDTIYDQHLVSVSHVFLEIITGK